ncbi:MAG TPA: thiamine pyrophosphate-dependent dehydrogenase E1 component subunit alpha [Gemmatimonadales bacterium]|nr:thiamine pyrophosphate-dependent dehydrogenase E1 component subunit alpha [Gemmatimonadales bacterium]
MQRFPAFDPPEYVNWRPDPEVVQAYLSAWDGDAGRRQIVQGLDQAALLRLYQGLLRARLHDIALKRWVRQGVISKAWLATGEEAATVGPVHALDPARDVVAPVIRNAAACCEMGLPVADMLRGYLGTYDSPSKGRDGHVGSFAHRVLQPISHLGNMPAVTAGVALALRREGRSGVALTWVGDGTVKAGPTHEALNFAAVERLPVIFIVQNNQVALGTRVEWSHLPATFDDLHQAYGCTGLRFDGNNVLDAYAATHMAVERCRHGEGPVMLSAATFRMGGHATHDEQEARVVLPADAFAYWGLRDPVGLYEEYLKARGLTVETLIAAEAEVARDIERAAEAALESRSSAVPAPDTAVQDVYAE